ncbi:MAG TPA: glycine oxidase ThiO [Pseudohongiella sp.]|nr:glycine oxidase ThiO [Pseudohongiella sp.]
MSDFLICGGGISGLLVARELVLAGANVHLVERGRIGAEASWAGGGIVSPLYPWRYEDAVSALANQAQDAYPSLASNLFAETGIDPELNECGLLMLDAEDHADALDWATRFARQMNQWQADHIYQHEPALAEGFTQALAMPRVANIRNPRLLKALHRWLQQHASATITEHCEVLGLNHADGTVQSVNVSVSGQQESFRTGHVVVAAGAWAGSFLEALGLDVPIEPVKGQMMLYKADRQLLTGIVLNQGRYLIPRRDNHILIGSTLEAAGFDKTTTRHAYTSLKTSAERMLPELADVPIVQHWAGLRPGAPRGVPFIGALPGFKNLSINAGHYRNGLVLAPASAALLADLVTGRQTKIDPRPYDPAQRLANTSFASHSIIADNSAQPRTQPR